MVDPQMERVTRHLTRLKLVATRDRLDALLQEAARKELGYLDFLDLVLSEEAQSKDLKRTRMGIQIAHFPVVRRLEDFDFSLQPSIDQKLIRELETGRFIANGENAAGGFGLTHAIARDFFAVGIDVITTGNHWADQKEILSFIGDEDRVLRPANYPKGTPGRGANLYQTRSGERVLVINAMGRVFMDAHFTAIVTGTLDAEYGVAIVSTQFEDGVRFAGTRRFTWRTPATWPGALPATSSTRRSTPSASGAPRSRAPSSGSTGPTRGASRCTGGSCPPPRRTRRWPPASASCPRTVASSDSSCRSRSSATWRSPRCSG